MKFLKYLIVLVIPVLTKAQSTSNERRDGCVVSLTTDQDFFYFSKERNEDRNYTMGFSLEVSHDAIKNWYTHVPLDLIKRFGERHSEVIRSSSLYASNVGILGTAFTPEKLDTNAVVFGDRPYAFFLGLTTRNVMLYITDSERHVYQSIGINYGVFGTHVGKVVQSCIHSTEWNTRPVPEGWSNQIGDGGSFTMLLDYNQFRTFRKLKDVGLNLTSKYAADGGWTWGASAGYYNRVYAGIGGRIGKIDVERVYDWFNAFTSLGSAAYQGEGSSGKSRHEYFLIGQLNGTFMLRNSMLEGRMFQDDIYVLPSEWTNPFIGEVVFGVGYSYKYLRNSRVKGLSLIYKNTIRLPEFNSGIIEVRNHYFGSAGIIASF